MDNVRLNRKTIEEGRALPQFIFARQESIGSFPPGTLEVFSTMLLQMHHCRHTWNSLGVGSTAEGLRLNAAIEFTSWAIAAGDMLLHKDERHGISSFSTLLRQHFEKKQRWGEVPRELCRQMVRFLEIMEEFIDELKIWLPGLEDANDWRLEAQRLQLALYLADIGVKLTADLHHAGEDGSKLEICWRVVRASTLRSFAESVKGLAGGDEEYVSTLNDPRFS